MEERAPCITESKPHALATKTCSIPNPVVILLYRACDLKFFFKHSWRDSLPVTDFKI